MPGPFPKAGQMQRAWSGPITSPMIWVWWQLTARRGTLAELRVMINHPIKMMLAQLGESIASALGEIGTAAVEWKYDGARVQIHKEGEKVRIFSRRMENVTASLPEIVLAARQITAKSAILDGEAVAIGKDGRPMAFQEILKRFRRKYNVEKLAAQIPLRLFLFDLIYLDGKSVTHLPLSERRALLEKIANPISSCRSGPVGQCRGGQRRSTVRLWLPAMKGLF